MRALLLGVVGVVLAVGAAEAKGCPITQAAVTVVDTGFRYAGVTREGQPDLVGKTFRIGRYASRRKEWMNPATGTMRLLGYEAYELKGSAGAFTAVREQVAGSPSVTPLSWASASLPDSMKIEWGGRPERVTVGKDLDYFLMGPLSALTLKVVSCHGLSSSAQH